MSDDDEQHLRFLVRTLDCFQSFQRRAFSISRLGGLTNRVYRLDFGSQVFVLRLSGGGTDAFINRSAECHNLKRAAALGLAPQVTYCDPEGGILVLPFLDHAESSNPGYLGRIASGLMQLHNNGEAFEGLLDPFKALALYQTMVSDAELLVTYDMVIRQIEALKNRWQDARPQSCPCHGDLVAGNIIDDGAAVRFIDWEYSGMSDPAFDLAYLICETGLSSEDEAVLKTAYVPLVGDQTFWQRVSCLKPVCDGLSALWAGVRALEEPGNNAFQRMLEDRMNRAYDRLETC
ncbi:choline kinase family protein [Coralliovum pocilloporae]|uniref:choline kinase family protein n=1 Tax=Coralliovum pocilloporae TaxID=3066369 RepID=UPI003307B291